MIDDILLIEDFEEQDLMKQSVLDFMTEEEKLEAELDYETAYLEVSLTYA